MNYKVFWSFFYMKLEMENIPNDFQVGINLSVIYFICKKVANPNAIKWAFEMTEKKQCGFPNGLA